MKLSGRGYGDNYTVNSYNEIVDAGGRRTGYVLRGNEILLSSNYRTVGWLHSFGAVDYANDYNGEKLFSRWSD